jgi:putative transposase
MKRTISLYHGLRFPASIVSHAIRWLFHFQLSLRGTTNLLFKCGVIVGYESIRR